MNWTGLSEIEQIAFQNDLGKQSNALVTCACIMQVAIQ
jgi:hypothetical protein